MKKALIVLVYVLLLMIIALVLSGCGIPQEQYDQLESELASSQQQFEELNTKVGDLTKANTVVQILANNSAKLNEELNTKIEDLTRANTVVQTLANNSAKLNEELSAIAAYSIWYSYHYETGAYYVDNVTAFNSQLGSLIAATGDANSQVAFDVYSEAQNDFNEVVASLPESGFLTISQFESWVDVGELRKEALGQVGGHLLNKIETIPWFELD